MSFMQRAREAADRAAEQARAAADQARTKANDPTNAERARQVMLAAGAQARIAGGAAKRGIANLVNPEVLADLIIKATAIQEKTNKSLRAKGSAYRVAEVTITATLPPQIGFSIARLGEIEEALTGHEKDSSELLGQVLAEEAARQAAAEANALVAGDPALQTELVPDVAALNAALVPEFASMPDAVLSTPQSDDDGVVP